MFVESNKCKKNYINILLFQATKGALLIDSSTVDPNVPKQIFPVATESGVNFIDAPVSGGKMQIKYEQPTKSTKLERYRT